VGSPYGLVVKLEKSSALALIVKAKQWYYHIAIKLITKYPPKRKNWANL
jgi:hypothetical protein